MKAGEAAEKPGRRGAERRKVGHRTGQDRTGQRRIKAMGQQESREVWS